MQRLSVTQAVANLGEEEDDEAANWGGPAGSLECVQGFCFGYDAITQHLGVNDTIACQVDDACCDDFSVAKVAVQACSRASDIALMASG
jgi:hypothetical protein